MFYFNLESKYVIKSQFREMARMLNNTSTFSSGITAKLNLHSFKPTHEFTFLPCNAMLRAINVPGDSNLRSKNPSRVEQKLASKLKV